jgi:hypothetical protein
MVIDKDDIRELRRIHFEETGETISEAEAEDMARRLLQLYRLFSQMPKDGVDRRPDLNRNHDCSVDNSKTVNKE